MLTIAVDKLTGVPDVTQSEEIVQFTITASGSYPAGGDVLSFANSNKIQSRKPPNRVEIYEEPNATTAQIATGYSFAYAKGTTQANGLLQINASQGVPFTTGAYGAAFATTTLKGRAWFPLGL